MLAWRKLKSELDEGKRSGEEIGWLLSRWSEETFRGAL